MLLQKLKTFRVLIIDDAALVLKRMQEMVEELPFVSDTDIAYNHAGAIQMLTRYNPDVVLLDIHLPDKSGIEILQYIKKNHPEAKVIMVTNKASDYYREICKEYGSHNFVDKSKEFEQIPEILKRYAELR
jgi:DNA-binding NarL/FixJ family response regulator